MQVSKHNLLAVFLIILSQHGKAQGTFQNLDFEQANIVFDPSFPGPPNVFVYASESIPGWTPYGYPSTTDILYNNVSTGSPAVSLCGLNSVGGTPPPIDGAFSIFIYGGSGPPPGGSISQTAIVPASAKSIQ